jgi:hypothetical protein
VLLGQDFRGRHEGHLEPVLHRDDRGEQRHDRLARSDVPLQQPVHRRRPTQVVHDLLRGAPLPRREVKRQHLRRRLPDAIVHRDVVRLVLDARLMAAPCVADLKQKELLEDQAALRRRAKGVELRDVGVARRKMAGFDGGAARHQLLPGAQLEVQQVGQLARQRVERGANQLALHVRRHRAGALVERHDAADVHAGQIVGHDLELRVQEVAGPLESSLTSPNTTTVGCGCGCRRGRPGSSRAADAAAGVGLARVEDAEAAPPRRGHVRALDLAEDRRLVAGRSDAIGCMRLRSS